MSYQIDYSQESNNDYQQSQKTDRDAFDSKKYMDPIHGYINLDKKYWDVIDTEVFQRTRQLKQLGCVNFVFPTAVHNRFEHCIGTCHIAIQLMKNLQQDQPGLLIREDEIFNVSLAGLCHDLGHGPFSHVFDNHFLRTIDPNTKWTHEWASTELLKYLVDNSTDQNENNPIDIAKEDIDLVCALITGDCQHLKRKDRGWLFDIINNKRNSIDVDKWDYIKRDNQMMNLSYGSYDHSILLKDARVIDNQIVYPAKHAYEVQKLFQCRYDHVTVHKIEIILCDILKEAHHRMYNFEEIIYNPAEYVNLTDNILYDIQINTNPEMKKAKELIKRLKRREFYDFVGEIIVPPIPENGSKWDLKFNEKHIADYAKQNGDGVNLREEDLALRKYSVNFCQGDRDPFEFVRFYNPPSLEKSYLIDRSQVSLITPNIFQEHIFRLFCRDPEKYDIAVAAFDAFCRDRFGVSPKKGKQYQKRGADLKMGQIHVSIGNIQ